MAPSSTKKTSVNGTYDEDEATSQPRTSVIDGSKINQLTEHLLKNLSGGLHGEFFEEGSKLDDKHRHGQLKAVGSLIEQLTEMNGHLKRQEQKGEGEQSKASKGAAQGNKNQITTVKSIVQQELSAQLRDLSIRNERLESDLKGMKKAAEKTEALEGRVKTLEAQLKKAEGRYQTFQQKVHESFLNELETKRKEILSDILGAERRLNRADMDNAIRQQIESKAGNAVRSDIHSIPVLQNCVIRLDNELEYHADRLEHIEGRMACKVPRPYSRIPKPERRTVSTHRRVFQL